jgi:hypothetical protein
LDAETAASSEANRLQELRRKWRMFDERLKTYIQTSQVIAGTRTMTLDDTSRSLMRPDGYALLQQIRAANLPKALLNELLETVVRAIERIPEQFVVVEVHAMKAQLKLLADSALENPPATPGA